MTFLYRLTIIASFILCIAPGRSASAQVLDRDFYPVFSTVGGVVYSIVLQPDQKVLVAGEFYEANSENLLSIMRLNPDGRIDMGFSPVKVSRGGSGPGAIHDVRLQPDGKIIIAGRFDTVSGQSRRGIARLNGDGSLDTSFQNGMTGVWDGTVYSAGIQSNGRIIIGGSFSQVNGASHTNMVRLHSNGAVDVSFANSQQSGTVSSLVVQSDDKVLMGGSFTSVQSTPRNRIARLNAGGSLDASFMATQPGLNDEVTSINSQPDGKILVAGNFTSVNGSTRNRIVRLLTNGDLDATFGEGLTGADDRVRFIAQRPDGKIMIGGSFGAINGTARNKLARLNADGSLDTSLQTALAGETQFINSVVTTQDGRIIAGGSFQNVGGAIRQHVARFNPDGSLDLSFPHVFLDQQGGVTDIARQADGKILVIGYFRFSNGVETNGIARMNPDGTRDLTFPVGIFSTGYAKKIHVLGDGKILVAGSFETAGPDPRRNIVRLNPNGSVDSSFQADINTGDIGSFELQPDGKIIVVGLFNFVGDQPRKNIARLHADGSLDATFMNGMPGVNNWVHTAVAQSDGKITIGGSFATVNGVPHNNLARLNSDGSLDQSFSANTKGMVEDIDLQPDGRYVISGYFFNVNGVVRNQIARLNANGSLDTTFLNGIGDGTNGEVYEVVLQDDGRILVSGAFNTVNGLPRRLARLLPNGNIDLSFRAIAIHHPWYSATLSLLMEPDGNLLVGGSFGKVDEIPRSGLFRVRLRTSPYDFDGDAKTDIGIFRPVGGASEWWINNSYTGSTLALQFGASTDKIAPADYTGDGKADITFFRPSSGEWYVLRSEDFSFFALPFGTNGDVPVPADYDADGKADFAVFRPSSSTWFISQSSGAPTRIEQFGAAGDRPVVSDYDGDGKADVGIFRAAASGAEWWINRSTAGLLAMQFGASTDKAVQGDYTGDGKTDIAIWRPSTGEWLIVRSEDFSFFGFPFGTTGDVIAPGDYDGDGKFDPTVFRPSSATWFIARTTAGTQIVQFGATGDRPLPNAFVP